MQREDFPILKTRVNGYPLAYLDNAATTQKPQAVIDALTEYYTTTNANVHRGVHFLSEKATLVYENARKRVQRFINAPGPENCIFVRGTTEAINLVAHSYGEFAVQEGDEILISAMEHHSNIVPWQLLCQRTGAKLKIIPMQENGELDLSNIEQLLNDNTKMIAIVYASNSLGTINPVEKIIALAKKKDIPVLIDGAQASAHFSIDVQKLDCDFYTMSSHKMYGPMGAGVLYAKSKWLEKLPPFQGGGDMILKVSFTETSYNKPPFKFEAGTPAVADIIGFGAALHYLESLNQTRIHSHEAELLEYATYRLLAIPGLKLIGQANAKIAVVSFIIDGIHPHDIGTVVNQYGVAVRTGHHCTMPVMEFYQIPATVRASFGIYNTRQEIDQLYDALLAAIKIFKPKK